MMAGASVGIAGAGGGAGMLRARRRDISIKPNRKLDRKSSRGMIYENEELRLRTIHINAEVEQGQNDIKKLRRENEQLRREIWSLRDEYDKLEEILKKQKSREESDEPEDRSEDEDNESEYSENNEEQDDEEDIDDDDDESESDDETAEENNHEERLENAENQKISTEKMNNGTPVQHRTRVNFDDLSVVDEEDEPKKDKEKKESSTEQLSQMNSTQESSSTKQNPLVYHATTSSHQTNPLTTTSFSYQTDCPFVFPSSGEAPNGYSNIISLDGNRLLMTTCPQLYTSASQQSILPLATHTSSPLNPSLDISTHNYSHGPLTATPPPPPGWQSSVSMLPAGGSPITVSKFPLVTETQSPSYDSRLASSKDMPLKPPEDVGVAENGPAIVSSPHPTSTNISSMAERRTAFFKQHVDNFHTNGPRLPDNVGIDTIDKSLENKDSEKKNELEGSINDRATIGRGTMVLDASTSIDNRPRHFFAPLPAKARYPYNGENPIRSIDDSSTRHSDSGNSPSSEKTVSTVISRSRYNCEKGSADICVNGAIPCSGGSQIDKGDAKAFFSSENLLIIGDVRNNESSGSSSNPLMKSVSCQDLSSRLSFTENLKSSNTESNHAKSDNTLDNKTTSTKAYRSQLNVILRQPRFRKSRSPDTPEIPKLPPIDYKLFNNPFLQNFEQAYQNFPVRTEGQSPVTHPLSIQVCESPVSATSYSSPVRIQPSFTSPSVTESDFGTCKRKDLERLRLMIPPAKLINQNGDKQEYQITSFETPSPHTVQIPPMTPYELEALRRMPTVTTPIQQNSKLYQNVPFVWNSMRMYYDSVSKVPAQTQTSLEDNAATKQAESEAKPIATSTESNQQTPESVKKRRSRKDKSGSIKEKRRSPSSQRRKDHLKKQTSVTSKDIPESPGKVSSKNCTGETEDDKNESRSSSSGQESPKKDQTKRVSLYFSTKKRPSLSSSVRTSRSRSVENARERHLTRGEAALDGNATNSERERTNSVSSREAAMREKTRKSSTSSGSVPWCACWGNGCI